MVESAAAKQQNKALSSKQQSMDKPNVLFICTDDQAPWALGASGNKQAITPNMDQLVSQGSYLVNSDWYRRNHCIGER